jgi:hypothetical protein
VNPVVVPAVEGTEPDPSAVEWLLASGPVLFTTVVAETHGDHTR